MSRAPALRQFSGLTAYALRCGYVQLAAVRQTEKNVQVTLRDESGGWRVCSYDHTQHTTLFRQNFHSLGMARKVWRQQARKHFAEELALIAKDKRFTYDREHHGECDPSYITRFEDAWVGPEDTEIGAMLLGYQHLMKVRTEADND